MADSIANILMQISGSSDDADDTLGAFLGKLKAFGQTEATAEADVRTGAGATKLTALAAALSKFDKTRAIAQAEVNVQSASLLRAAAEIQAFEQVADKRIEIPVEIQREGMDRALAGLQTLISSRNLEIEPRIDRGKVRADLAATLSELSASITGGSSVLPDVDVDINLNQAAALSGLAVVGAAIRAVGDQHVEVDVDTSQLLTVPPLLVAIEAGLKTLGADSTIIDVNTAAATAKMAVFRAALEAVVGSQQEIEIPIDTTNIQTLRILLAQLADEQIDVTVGLDDEQALSRLAAFMVAAHGVERDIHTDVEVDDTAATAKLAALVAEIQFADSQRINIDADVSKVSLATLAMAKLGSLFSGIGEGATRMGSAIGGITVNVGAFGLKLTTTTAIVLTLAAAMAVSLVGALALLVSSLASATAAVGVLATAFVAALGPAIALAIATVTRITKIVQALKAKNTADKASAAGSKEAAAAEEQRHNALQAVGQALRGVESAERGREQAIQGAKDAITQAHQDEASASDNAAQAARNLETQTVAAYAAMRQAAEDVRDAILGVEDAQLGIDKSDVAVRRAEFELKKLRGEAGLLGGELNDTFNKFTDVDFQGSTSGAFSGLLKGTGGGDKSAEEQQLAIEEAVIRVREAKQGEKHATDTLGDSIQALNDKRRIANNFAREGIAAFEPYTAAIQQQKDATIRLADATERANRLDAQGVANNPSVIAANEALTNANLRLVEARHDAAAASTGAAGGAAARKAKQDWDALSVAEQGFALTLSNVGAALKTALGPATSAVLTGLASGLAQLPAAIAPLRGAFTSLGVAIGGVSADFGSFLNEPKINDGMKNLINGSAQLANILGGEGFQSFFRLMMNIANAAMPLLIQHMKEFVGLLTRLADRTDDPKKLGGAFATLDGHLRGILELIKQVGRVFIHFFASTSGDSKGFVKTLAGMAKTLADFLGSAKGKKELHDFFAAVIPLAIQTMKFMGNVIVLVLQLVEILAPALTGILSVINLIFGAFNRLINIFIPFLQVAGQLVLLFGGGLPLAVGKFIGKVRLLAPLAGFLARGFVGAIAGIIGKLGFLASVVPGIFDRIKNSIFTVIGFIADKFNWLTSKLLWPFKKLLEFVGTLAGQLAKFGVGIYNAIKKPFQDAINFINKLGGQFYKAGKGIVEAIINGMKSLLKDVGGIAGKVFKFLVDKLPGSEPKDKSSPLAGLAERGKAIMSNLAAGIPQGQTELSMALHRSLVPVVAGINTNVAVPRTTAPVGATAAPGAVAGGPTENHFHLEVPAGQLPDAEATVRAIARRMERKGGGSPRA